MSDMSSIHAEGTAAMREQAGAGISISERICVTWGPKDGAVEETIERLRMALVQEGVSPEDTHKRLLAFRNASASISEQASFLADAFSRYSGTIRMIEQVVLEARANTRRSTFKVDA